MTGNLQRLLFVLAVARVWQPSLEAGEPVQPSPAASSAPNIVIILIDDIGFGNTSAFGGAAQTPFLDQFALHSLRYNNFNTVAICSATRASLLTGLNHHRVGFGTLADTPGTTPGYNTRWRKNAISIATILGRNGYSTAAIGKWHNTPWKEIGPEGPFDRWPTGLGFDYFYGFMEPGAQSEWEPASLYQNTTPVEPWGTPQQGYYLTTDLTDHAIHWLETHASLAPAKPYFLYFATGAVHFPHQVAQKWIDQYQGKFDQGWDRLREEVLARQKTLGVVPLDCDLTVRPKEIPAWTSLTQVERRVYARQMEVYAGFIAETDAEVGRLVQAVQHGPGAHNTLIFYIVGDNGGSPGDEDVGDMKTQLRYLDELGGPLHINGLVGGWGWASSAPFQWFKGVASHFGAVRNPLLVSWPAHIDSHGGLRTQFAHVNDIAPTIYDAAGITYPNMVDGLATQPLDGVSFRHTFADAKALSRHHTQYFEMFGNRAIYVDGWVAAARHISPDFDRDPWELYHVAEDYSEAHDLAKQNPDKLKSLEGVFESEAKKNEVYPLGGSGPGYSSFPTASEFVFHQGMPRILGLAAPNFLKSHRITANVTVPADGAQGIIVSFGGRWSGFVLYVKNELLIYENKEMSGRSVVIASSIPLPRGKVQLAFEFTKNPESEDGRNSRDDGVGRLYINGKAAGEAELTMDARSAYWGCFGVGKAFGSPVSDAYQLPFSFSGLLEQLKVELK